MAAGGVEGQGKNGGVRFGPVAEDRSHPGGEENFRKVQVCRLFQFGSIQIQNGILGGRTPAVEGVKLAGENSGITLQSDLEDVHTGRSVFHGVRQGEVATVGTELINGGLKDETEFGVGFVEVHGAGAARGCFSASGNREGFRESI